MDNINLSIIIPVYNVKKYITNTLTSILKDNKILKNEIEILLIDDGSNDGSEEICDKYAGKYSFIKVLHQKNQGQAVARNTGLKVAKGNWITFVDSDDLVRKDYLSILLSIIKNIGEADIIIFKYKTFKNNADLDDRNINDFDPKHRLSNLSKKSAMYSLTTTEIGNYMWNKVFKRDLFKNVKFPSGRRYEDLAVLYKYFHLAENICLYDDYLYFYRQRDDSTIHVQNEDSMKRIDLLKEEIRARREQLKFFEKNGYSDAYINAYRELMNDETLYIFWTYKFNLEKDILYKESIKNIASYHPKIKNDKKIYLFVKMYNMFPRFTEKCVRMISKNN